MSKRAERAIEAYYGNIPDDADKVKAARHFYEQAEKDIIFIIESRLSELLGDATLTRILRRELQDLIKKIKEEE